MDFDFSDGQYELQKEARRFLEQQCPPSHVREVLDDPAGWSRTLWKQMADLGWMALPFEEKYGGLGQGYLDLVLLLGELGRALAPVPFLSSVAICGMAIDRCGSEEQKAAWLPKIASGEAVFAFAWASPDGVGSYVLDAPCADALLVQTESGLRLHDGGFEVTPQRGYDLTRTIGHVRLAGEGEEMPGYFGTAMKLAIASVCAEMVGVASKVLDMSVEYSKVREQFGRPIGSFQAIKHKCAEMAMLLEAARSGAFYAAWAADADAEDAALAAHVAKSYCSDACGWIGGEGIQVHGGIAYTWEHDMHLYTRRIKSLEPYLGDAAFHREMIAQKVQL